ncbi:MAG: AAA family ATPase [Bacteroidales bacterium]|nr:AAA family ATPase [Bacteroidales bacterium]
MFYRDIIDELKLWVLKTNRKPLVLRGARQVGKTTAIQLFANDFDQYINLNLENESDRKLFEDFKSLKELVRAIFYLKNKSRDKGQTLIFIDEIQECPEAVRQLRYFYEEAPDLFVIAAGSLLETLFDKDFSFPVGRVEYLVMRPVSFREFLRAIGEVNAANMLEEVPLPAYASVGLLKLFHIYTLVGGMPEVVRLYSETGDLSKLGDVYDSLLVSYLDDVEKYASHHSKVDVLRHVIQSAFVEGGTRVKFQGFGNSQYRSREVGEAFRTLEKAMLAQLVYPTTATKLPMLPDKKKAPRLQVLDTGLLNYYSGIQSDLIGVEDLTSEYFGKVAEHVVGQELLSLHRSVLYRLPFWVREKRGACAEVDFLFVFKGKLIPIEVKSGAKGKLRSLHQFMELSEYPVAIRLYAGALNVQRVNAPSGRVYTLLNLPYYLTSQIGKYIEWVVGDEFVVSEPASVYGGVLEGVNRKGVQLSELVYEGVKNEVLRAIKVSGYKVVRSDVFNSLVVVMMFLFENQGVRTGVISEGVKIPLSTLERHLRVLKLLELIEFRGAPKTGGYFVTEHFRYW